MPWLLLAAPLAAVMLRVTLAAVRDTLEEPYVRTARGEGPTARRVLRRHAAPPAYMTDASVFASGAPFVVLDLALVEYVFEVPGFFVHTRRATGNLPVPIGPRPADPVLLQALALWAAVLVVVLGLVGDLAIWRLAPQLRAGAAGRAR